MSRPLALRPLIAPRLFPLLAARPIRHASSSTSSSAPAQPRPTPAASAAAPSAGTIPGARQPLPLTWPAYLSLRRNRRLWSTFASVPTSFAGLFLGGGYFASLEADPTHLIMGLEPMIVYGLATLGCTALGYLLGPTLGSSLFSLTHPSIARGKPSPLEIMDRELFEHIKRNRVDPRFQSVSNLPPDYYGEKIDSIKTYRRWLRDQATYMRKAKHGVPDESE